MAVSDGMLAMVMAVGLLYIFMFNHRIRWVRMVGAVIIIIVSGALGIVEDTIIMYTLFLVNLVICGLRFVSEVTMLPSKKRNARGWF